MSARNHRPSLAEAILYVSLPFIFLFLALVRPAVSFYALLLAPIALAAVLYEFAGGTLVALVAMVGVALLIALDPVASRRATMLQDIWPILVVYLAAGPLVGWLAARERARAKALAAISDAGREIAASLDLDRTLQLVITKAAETLPMDAGALFLFDEESKAAGQPMHRVAASYNLAPGDEDRITFAFHEGVPGWVVKHRQPLLVPDATADPRVHPYVVEGGVQAVMAIPLIAREKIVGVLNLFYRTKVSSFDDETLRLAQVYADQAAVFIENARLVGELRRAATELETRVEQRTRELRETQARVVRAEKLAVVGRLAASVAHEVNNPLQAVALHLQLMAEEGLNEAAREQMAIVRQELDRIAAIANRLLDFQRPKEGYRTPQNVVGLLEEVLTLAGKQLQQANVAVFCQGLDHLSPVLADGGQLKQVFLNLVLNAMEAMPGGGQLHIAAEQVNGTVALSFSDTGGGLVPEAIANLFEPFFSTKHEGTGLGLAVSQEIVVAHGGTLEAASQSGRGATFTVKLPAHQESP
ncbi:MAG: ATP-binding protein [Chloroflexi bacterium]|nr:ATP-binding protein [Chloroflexota bacterium]MCI0575756.1 ATP-binding protein [Chloroflexota bacterium]MCI0643637.1 ATP-binding protein [Chloroflexota bacterium]MCI0729822.1 ATP-binding protein [Chloroflexota bacterium]